MNLSMKFVSFTMAVLLVLTPVSANAATIPSSQTPSNTFAENLISKDKTALQESILEKDFDISQMTATERTYYDSVVQASLTKAGGKSFNTAENRKIVKDIMADKAITDGSENESVTSGKFYTKSVHRIMSVSAAGKILNAVIDVALLFTGAGGIVDGGIRALIKKFGYNEARSIIKQQIASKVVSTLIKWGMTGVAAKVEGIVSIILENVFDPGTAIAEWIDSWDAVPNNGYIDVTF